MISLTAHGICNITLTTSVRSYNTSNSIVKLKYDFVGKGLKSMNFNTFQIHKTTVSPT